jgi:hypothetical protein
MPAADIDFDKITFPYAVDAVVMGAHSFHFPFCSSIGMSSRSHHFVSSM